MSITVSSRLEENAINLALDVCLYDAHMVVNLQLLEIEEIGRCRIYGSGIGVGPNR